MTRHHTIATLVLLAASLSALRAAGTNTIATPSAPQRLNLDSFRIISERNIFNPGRYPGADIRTVRREPDRRARVDSFALVGTMSFEKGRFAFFDGSSADFRKVIGTTESIAGYTVAEVTTEHVTLQSTNQQEIKLPVGMQMRRVEEGEWELSARTEQPAGSNASASASSSTTSAGAGDDEVLKRMMQRREQEGAPPTPPASPEPVLAPPEPERPATPEPASGPEAEILRRLQQQREQELRK